MARNRAELAQHVLKHTGAVIQNRLGHSRWHTTADWYIESDREGEREAANVASRLLEVG
jgi:hypothetical protein